MVGEWVAAERRTARENGLVDSGPAWAAVGSPLSLLARRRRRRGESSARRLSSHPQPRRRVHPARPPLSRLGLLPAFLSFARPRDRALPPHDHTPRSIQSDHHHPPVHEPRWVMRSRTSQSSSRSVAPTLALSAAQPRRKCQAGSPSLCSPEGKSKHALACSVLRSSDSIDGRPRSPRSVA